MSRKGFEVPTFSELVSDEKKRARIYSFSSIFLSVSISFFVTLASFDFDFSRVKEAEFIITFATIYLLGEYIFNVFTFYGGVKGKDDNEYTRIVNDIISSLQFIDDNKLNEKFSVYIHYDNLKKRYDKVIYKVNKKIRKRKLFFKDSRNEYWKQYKIDLLKFKDYINTRDEKKLLELETDSSFSLLKVRYNKITYNSFYSNVTKQTSDDKLTFNFGFEAFNESFLSKITFLVITFYFLIFVYDIDKFEWVLLLDFLFRVFIILWKAFSGFRLGYKIRTVNNVSILSNKHNYLAGFINKNGGL